VFVGHCLGGLVVKQAICFANSEPEFASIASATKGIIFFGTPHGGADKDSWKQIANGYSLLAGPRSSLVNAITRASDDLEEIKEDFVQLSPLYPITSFYEKGHWGNTGKCIVSPASARMMIDNEYDVGVDADHRAICQFQDAEEAAFEMLCERIEKAVGRDVVDGREDSGEGMAGKPTELAVAAKQESQAIPMWSADGSQGLLGGDMGGYTLRRVMMIEETRVPADDVLPKPSERMIVVDDTPVLKQADCIPLTSTPVKPAEASGEGHRQGFFRRFNKFWS
jgi:hypothetical protein